MLRNSGHTPVTRPLGCWHTLLTAGKPGNARHPFCLSDLAFLHPYARAGVPGRSDVVGSWRAARGQLAHLSHSSVARAPRLAQKGYSMRRTCSKKELPK